MNKSFLSSFKVGMVVIVGVLITLFLITRLTQDFTDGEETYLIHALFDDATGLSEKSQVRIAGIQVGEIAKIELVGARAKVTLRIRRSQILFQGKEKTDLTEIKWKNGAVLTKKLSSLLGDYYLELTPGLEQQNEKNVILNEGDQIMLVTEAQGTDAILQQMEKITQDISSITGSLSEVIGGDEGRERLDRIVTDISITTQAIRDLIEKKAPEIDEIIANARQISEESNKAVAETRAELRGAMQNVREMSRDAQITLNRAGQKVNNSLDKVDDGIEQAVAAIARIDRSLEDIEAITTDARKVAKDISDGKGSAGRLLRDETIADEAEGLIEDTRTLVQKANSTIEEFDDIFGTIGRMETHINWRGDYMTNFNTFKHTVSLKLQPSPNKWYQIELINDPRGTSNTIRRTRDASGEQSSYEEITETTSDFKVSLLYAGRHNWLGGRFGIMENSGGLGFNIYLWEDNFEFVTDVFDFSFSDNPRLRTYAMLHPFAWADDETWSYLYLSGGADDIFNAGTRDYFLGVGIGFTDNDIKGMLPFAP